MGGVAATDARRDAVVLSALQQRVARIVADLPEAEQFALAGGAALVLAQIVDRETRDLDFFGPSADDVDALADAVEAALVEAGMNVRRERSSHGFARLAVSHGGELTEVDLGVDARIRPTEPGPYGPTMALEELAADKLLALFDRAQARDFIDVDARLIVSDWNDCASLPPRKIMDSRAQLCARHSVRSAGSPPPTSASTSRADNDSPPLSSNGGTRSSAHDPPDASTDPTPDSHSDRLPANSDTARCSRDPGYSESTPRAAGTLAFVPSPQELERENACGVAVVPGERQSPRAVQTGVFDAQRSRAFRAWPDVLALIT